ncbi:Protein IMPACT [Candida viswanathii]|uniref:Protein IMPACT n=1 Tax=Candida viswanathii TaxID=5486 RepID=A0A367YAC5_9ASCO|nr:Protein IMPACT [Candida viswanathii]
MTVEELQDEIGAIDAIYPETVLTIAPQIYTFKIPQHESLSIQLNFPTTYPDEIPQLLQIINENTSRFADVGYLEKNINEILNRVFIPEQVVMFEFLTELQEFFDKYVEEHPEPTPTLTKPKVETPEKAPQPVQIEIPKEVIDPTIGWIQSEPILDRGSTFIGYARKVDSLQQAQDYLNNLITDKKISRAAHNISSWRIKMENGVVYQDCDDDGETAAGGRLLHLLQMMDAWNVIVVVSRWFGGTHIGPDRFKHINSAAREAVIKGKFVNANNDDSENGNNNTKKKKK